jgi:hypothetical protein
MPPGGSRGRPAEHRLTGALSRPEPQVRSARCGRRDGTLSAVGGFRMLRRSRLAGQKCAAATAPGYTLASQRARTECCRCRWRRGTGTTTLTALRPVRPVTPPCRRDSGQPRGFPFHGAPEPCAARPRAAGSTGGCPGRRDNGRSGREYTYDLPVAEYAHGPDGNRHSPRTARAESVLILRPIAGR